MEIADWQEARGERQEARERCLKLLASDFLLLKEYGEDGLISHNPKYPLIPKEDLIDGQIVGKVIGTAENFFAKSP